MPPWRELRKREKMSVCGIDEWWRLRNLMVELVFFSCGGLWAGWPAKGSATKKRTKTNNSTNNGARKESLWMEWASASLFKSIQLCGIDGRESEQRMEWGPKQLTLRGKPTNSTNFSFRNKRRKVVDWAELVWFGFLFFALVGLISEEKLLVSFPTSKAKKQRNQLKKRNKLIQEWKRMKRLMGWFGLFNHNLSFRN